VKPEGDVEIESTDIKSRGHIPGTAEGIGVRYSLSKPADPQSTITISRSGEYKPCKITIPARHTLKIAAQIKNSGLSGQDILDAIEKHHPETGQTRYYEFHNNARSILPPHDYLRVIRAVETNSFVSEFLNQPQWWVADWVLGYWDGRRVSNEETVLSCVDEIQDDPGFKDIKLWGVIGEAVCAPGEPQELNASIPRTLQADVFDNKPWNQIVDALGFAVVVLAYSSGGEPEEAREIARNTPSLHTEGSYEAAKQIVKTESASPAEKWARLLPDAAEREDEEWLYALANTAYWVGEKARGDGYFRISSPLLYAASGMANAHDLDEMAVKARARSTYTEGLELQFRSKYESATGVFEEAAVTAQSPDTKELDIHTALLARDQGAVSIMRRVQQGTLSASDGLAIVEKYIEKLPANSQLTATIQDTYEDTATYLLACRDDLTARSSDKDAESTEITDLVEEAVEKYHRRNRKHDAEKLADRFEIGTKTAN